MSPSSWLSWPFSSSHTRRGKRPLSAARRKKARLFLEELEIRVTPSFGLSNLGFFGTIVGVQYGDGTNGANPWSGVIMDGSGNLYGTATSGGADGDGTVFELAKGSNSIIALASFNGSNGADPYAGLTMDSSGNLYGTTHQGGAYGEGTVFELAKGSGTINALASFNPGAASDPSGNLIIDSSGNLYGTTTGEGVNDDGTIFELPAGSGAFTTLASFDGTNGESPNGIIMDGSGNFYGTTEAGGADNDGTVFKLATNSGTIVDLASFNGTDGSGSQAAPILDSSGNLYGTTSSGGTNGDGTVFKLAKGSNSISTLASFNGSDGYNSLAGLIMDGSGNLYGTTYDGGVNGYGTVFELANGSSAITDLASFDSDNGSYPTFGLIMDSSGNFYGTTSEGGLGSDDSNISGDGSVFEVRPHTPALSWPTPGSITYGTALTSAQLDASAADSVTGAAVAGKFVYTPAAGTIVPGGLQTLSVTFTPTNTTDYSPITTITTVVVNPATPLLSWSNPAPITAGTPLSSVQLDATASDPTSGGPASGTLVYTPPAGTIVGRGLSTLNVTFMPTDPNDYWSVSASVTLVVGPSSGLSNLALFNGADGANPHAGLFMDSSGNVYGTTEAGGASGDGTVFKIAAGSGTITTLASFNGSDGSDPGGALIMDSSGNLYGTAADGGADGFGTVFKVAAGSGTITPLASFNGTNGTYPDPGLVMDSAGNLYGTASEAPDGTGDGSVFELASGSGTITTMAVFNGTYGTFPAGGLVLDKAGDLYGTTYEAGASGDGTVFEIAAGSGTLTTLASFDGTDGAAPNGIIIDGSGNLYGTTEGGGASSYGTVFELAAGSGTITTLASFNGTDGDDPQDAPIIDSSGNFYGTTKLGGASGDGTVFELASGSGTLSTLVSFNPATNNGSEPIGGLIMDKSGNLYGTASASGVGYSGTASSGDGVVFEVLPRTPVLNWTASPITYGTALSSTQLDATAVDSGTGAAVAGTFAYTPAAGTIPHGGWQTLTVTFTPTDTSDYSPITTNMALLVNQAAPVLAWSTPAPIAYGTALTSTQLDATATNPNTGLPLSGTFVYTPETGTVVLRGTTILTGTFTPTDTTDFATGEATVTLVVTPSYSALLDVPFNGTNNGADPFAGLIMDGSGNFYGTTESGGANDRGTVFELAKGSNTITTLASFIGSNGSYPSPVAGLIMDSSGDLYGTTEHGGASGDGAVFELAKGSNTITTLGSFNVFNGSEPVAGLVMDSSGNVYGTTPDGAGGAGGARGNIFELVRVSNTITTLASFNGTNGGVPVAGLIMDSSGNLYGTTEYGGVGHNEANASGDGTVFELAKGSNTITTLASFQGADGENPVAGLIMDSSGDLYGTTEFGGIGYSNRVETGDGTVFEVAKGSSTINTLAYFSGANGQAPQAGLILDSSGNLYGTTGLGGTSKDGTIFEVGAGSGVSTTMVSFGGSNGEDPVAGLIMDSSGNLYGTTKEGGADGAGTVFELPIVVQPSFHFSGMPSLTTAGTPQTFTLTAQNVDGTTDTGYTGTVHFTSSDPKAVLPANFTFTAADDGQYTFTATLETAGAQSITATDTASSTITGSEAGIAVSPAAAASLVITGLPASVQTGTPQSFTVSADDAYGNVATGYTGTVAFTSTDAKATLPASYMFTAADAGRHTFSVTFQTTGQQTVTATDTASSSLTTSASTSVSSAGTTATASFLQQDTTTQGSWIGTYGAQGYDIISGPTSLPANDTVTSKGESTYTWTTTSTDPRALQVPGSTNRVAAVWYSSTSFTVDVNLGDGQTHDLELYFLDWDSKGRGEQVQLSDAGTGKVLDTETISSFTNGVYLDWKVSGNLVITITRTAGANAVLNGVFLDSTSSPTPTATASFLQQDTTTQGSWVGTYGAQGYDIISGPTSLPANDTVTSKGESTYTWTTTSTDPRALQVPGSTNRVAAVWYSSTSFTVDVNLGDGQTHDLELYFLDWDSKGRSEQVQISDAGTGTVLDTETISSFTNGVYLDWKVSGNLVITITRTAGANAVLNGVFLDSTSSPTPTATASFLQQDTTTQGSWIGTYGAQGYDIVSGPTSLPANDTVTSKGESTYTWTTTSTDPRALQVPGSTNRVAAVWYSSTSFTVDVNLGDGQTHDLELYFVDWDSKGRSEQVQISDAGTGNVLATETISSFTNGVYLDWKVSGNLVITITRQAGANAVLNGVFLDAAPVGGTAYQVATASSVNTGSPLSPSIAGAPIARGSSGGFAIGSAGGAVDAVLGALPDDGDAPAAGSWVHDLAIEQVSETGSGARIRGTLL